MKPLHPLAPRFLDDLLAWWWPGAPVRQAPAPQSEERNAVHRWEDEGGNVT
ncbi:MAG TPA: hypothetical protein VFA72_14840 [Burkholderiales bacterium]|nr:hypothetical protein [Burkholderiales bacterium]